MRIVYTNTNKGETKMKLEKENLSRRINQKEVKAMQQQPEVTRWLRKVESEKSRIEYTKHLIRYTEATKKTPKQLIQLKSESKNHEAEDLLDEFVDECKKIEYSNNMTCAIVVALKSFYKWNYEDLSRGAGKITRIKQKPYRTPDRKSLLNFIESSHIRDKALISFMACTGIAEGSIPQLKWKHVSDIESDVPHISLTSREIKGKGKGVYQNIEQHTFLTPYAKKALLTYKAWRERKEKRALTPQDYMFATLDKPYKNLEIITIRAIFIRRSKDSGVEFSAHDLRRFVQTELEHARLQPNWIKKILRHKVKGEEAPYSRPKIEALREAYKTALPYLDLSEKPMISEEAIIEKLKEKLDHERVIREVAKKYGISIDSVKDMAEKFDLMKYKGEPMAAKLEEIMFRRKQKKPDDCQHMINESELKEWLTKGFKVVAVLPSGKIVISND